MSSRFKNILIIGIRKIKKCISRTPTGSRFAARVQKTIFQCLFKSPEALFTYYYHTNKWGNNESLSGPGSSLTATSSVRKQIHEILVDYKVKKLLDAPCGDFNWFKLVAIPFDIEYIGGDIVKKMVDLNNKQFGKGNIKFMHLDIINNEIPIADLWLCRDAIFHFSNADGLKTITNLRKSKIKYFLSTTFPDLGINQDISTGDYRPINLEIAPFNLPPPLKYIEDSDAGHYGKKLGLWIMNNI